MQLDQSRSFGSYRFTLRTGQLWRGKQEVKLTPKAATLLRYLVERVGTTYRKEKTDEKGKTPDNNGNRAFGRGGQ